MASHSSLPVPWDDAAHTLGSWPLESATLVEPKHQVAILDRAGTVGDDDHGLVAVQGAHRRHQLVLGFDIKGVGGLVQNQQRRVVVKRPGDADALSLTTGQADASFADLGIEPMRQLFDECLQLHDANYAPNGVVVDLFVGQTKSDIAAQAVVGQEDGLRHVADIALPGTQAGLNVDSIHRDHAGDRKSTRLNSSHG